MNYTVLGAGMMGSAVAYDLATHEADALVTLADLDADTAARAAAAIGPAVRPLQLDAHRSDDLRRALEGTHVVISAVSYTVNEDVTREAVRAGIHMVDLGGNNDVVRRQQQMDREARERGVTVVPNAGLAPGLINILAMTGVRQMDRADSVHLRVGGLPKHPRPPFNYQIVFSVEGLINEYVEKAEVIRGGKRTSVESLADCETIDFPPPYGRLEAFSTSGGISLLPELLEGKVQSLDYKTVRYPGHCERMRTLIDLGFASNEPWIVGDSIRTSREVFAELLRKRLPAGGEDVVLARATVVGILDGKPASIVYEFIDEYDHRSRMSAMMRTTSFPVAIIAQMLAHGVIMDRGVLPPELCVPGERMVAELGLRNIVITQRQMEGVL